MKKIVLKLDYGKNTITKVKKNYKRNVKTEVCIKVILKVSVILKVPVIVITMKIIHTMMIQKSLKMIERIDLKVLHRISESLKRIKTQVLNPNAPKRFKQNSTQKG